MSRILLFRAERLCVPREIARAFDLLSVETGGSVVWIGTPSPHGGRAPRSFSLGGIVPKEPAETRREVARRLDPEPEEEPEPNGLRWRGQLALDVAAEFREASALGRGHYRSEGLQIEQRVRKVHACYPRFGGFTACGRDAISAPFPTLGDEVTCKLCLRRWEFFKQEQEQG